ncbi:hypothetical protein NXV74_16490 [Bacteroides thetaiotaomicron]|nr:hypothetical protein [Bacteroides thetaiotaomicron]
MIGEITNEAARETGLLAGTPVICGGGDGSCAGVGVGCVAPGTAYNYLELFFLGSTDGRKADCRRTTPYHELGACSARYAASVGNDAGGRIILQLDDQPALPE